MNQAELQQTMALCRARMTSDPDDVDATYALALLVRQERPAEALDLLGRCLALQASRHDIRFDFANLLRRTGRSKEAVREYMAVLDADKRHFRALTNLGNCLREFGHHQAALECYNRAIAAGGDLPEVWLNKAVALHKLGKTDSALGLLAELSAASPPLVEALFEQARILGEQKRFDEALSAYAKGLALEPDNARALNSRGNLFVAMSRTRSALADFNKALQIVPAFHEALNNRANLLRNMGQFNEALADYDAALTLRAGLAEVLVNRGNVLRDLSRFDDALLSLQQAIDIDPGIATAYMHAGRINADLGRLLLADQLFDRALELKPDLWECWFYKGGGLRELGEHTEALRCFKHILDANPEDINLPSLGNYLFSMNFDDGIAADDYLAQARLFGQLVARRVDARFSHARQEEIPPYLNVGLVSGDLSTHPVGFFLRNLLPHLQGGRLRLHVYANSSEHDAVSEQLKVCCDAWHVVPGLSERHLAQKIVDDGIHILFDLSGHTDKSRLPVFAWKPAPVQVSWLGYCASTGLEEIDYVLGDHIVTPYADAAAFVERIWQMPESYFCFSPPTNALPIAPLPALANDYVTFGCFNKLSKMSDGVVSVWASILLRLPGSRLLMKSAVLANQVVCKETLGRFAKHGVPATRLLLEGSSDYEDYLSAYGKVDIALDPFPYPGATTTLEGLWMGVPCVTMKGKRFLARNGETIAFHTGLKNFIATDVQDYVERAVAIASDLPALATLRAGLREQVRVSPLFDGARFARNFERAAFEIWNDHQQRQPDQQ